MYPSTIFFMYAVFVIVSGVIGFGLANFESKAKTALIMGSGVGTVMTIFGIATRPTVKSERLRRTAEGVGRYLLLIFAGVFCWRGSKLIGVSEKAYLLNLFIVLGVGSVAAFLALSTSHKSPSKGSSTQTSTATATAKKD